MQPSSLRAGARITTSLELLRPLGAGGMGAVWVARHHGLGSNVVVKFISAELAESGEALARFKREAAAAAEVRSPHVVQMLDHGVTNDGVPFIAMELLEGESLRERLDREGSLAPALITTVIAHCAKALTRAHERGVVHRDIKPDNIFLTDSGDGEVFAKVLDFGIAKSSNANMAMTTTGAALGSPYYMSPEQVLGSKSIDARSDLWSLGVTTYEALTGRRPFDGETIGALSVAICHSAPLPPTQVHPGLPPALDAWFAKACAVDVQARFSTAKELSDALARVLSGAVPMTAPKPEYARTVPMTTTGVGAQSSNLPRPAPASNTTWLVAASLSAILVIGLIGLGVVGLSRRDASPASDTRAESELAPAPKPSPKPSVKPSASVEVLELNELAPTDAGAAPKPAPAPAPKPTGAAAKAAITSPSSVPTNKPAPKVQHDPNIF